jgi:hypothetical protein
LQRAESARGGEQRRDEADRQGHPAVRIAQRLAGELAHRLGALAPDAAQAGRGANRLLVGQRAPGSLVAGPSVRGRAFPEGAALVIESGGSDCRVLGILMLAPIDGGGFHACG